MHDLLNSVILLGAVQGAALATALAARQKNRLANRILAALVGALSLMLLLGVLERRWGFASHPHLIGLGVPLPFLFGPLLYLYVAALTRPAARFEARWLVHGLPFATHLNHSSLYRSVGYSGAKDGWYSSTGGTLQVGLRGGYRVGRVELSLAAGVLASEGLNAVMPPFYGTLGSAYAF